MIKMCFLSFARFKRPFYNERLEIEINKRKNLSNQGQKQGWQKHISKSYDNHMENEIENEIEVKDVFLERSENLLLKIKGFCRRNRKKTATRRLRLQSAQQDIPDVIKSMIPDFVDVCITKSRTKTHWYNYCNYLNWLANEFFKTKNSTQTKSPSPTAWDELQRKPWL